MEGVAQLLLMYAVVPLLVLAGLADWAFHRHTEIEVTSGLRENQYHWLLFAEGALALAAAADGRRKPALLESASDPETGIAISQGMIGPGSLPFLR